MEVGCWYHARRRFWEATVAKNAVAGEGLMRIGRIFELDESWKKKPPSQIKQLRETYLRPHALAFFSEIRIESSDGTSSGRVCRPKSEFTVNPY